LFEIGRSDYIKTIKWLKEVNPAYITVSILAPYEGTGLNEYMKMYPEIVDAVPAQWNWYSLEYVKKDIGEDVIDELFGLVRERKYKRFIRV
jgi:radical SAM superfamily enzyme YgiQ (UPF0313 family)